MRSQVEQETSEFIKNLGSDGPHQLCLFDIDKFRVLNGGYGYTAGDKLIREVLQLIEKFFGNSVLIKHYSGDQYISVIPNASQEKVIKALERFQQYLSQYRYSWKFSQHEVTVSIGVVQFTGGDAKIRDLIHDAEIASDIAKTKGRSVIEVFDSSSEIFMKNHEEMLWVERVNRAMEEDRFYLYYQPIIPFKDDCHERHYEILLRMKDKEGNLIAPGNFLPALERFNLSAKMDRWIMQTFFSWLEAYDMLLDMDIHWAINLSGLTLADTGLHDFLKKELENKQIPPEKVYFEITETAAIQNMKSATLFINAMREMGCRFALDDFGSGLSSYSYLKHIEVDFIKIDGQFVEGILESPINEEIVNSIHRIARTKNIRTIAEFANTDEVISRLKEIGIDFGQGMGIAEPKPLYEFLLAEKIRI